MKITKDTPTFWKDGKRRVKCPHCGRFLGRKGGSVIETRLTDNKDKFYRCFSCNNFFIVQPPKKELNEKREKIIKWGTDRMYTTADLTENDYDDTILLD